MKNFLNFILEAKRRKGGLAFFISEYMYFFILCSFCLLIIFVNIRINSFRYNNFDFGKFDLGNMTQMIWNTLHGRFMYLTDYFGTNLPRWAMSHVDPILLLFIPVFVLFPHSLTLVYSQVVLVTISAIILYNISDLVLKSKLSAFFIALAFLFYPAIGFLTAWTGFHGVTVAIPFFLGAFYVFEKMHENSKFTKTNLLIFWMLLLITLMGKEQISLYIFMYGFYIWLFRGKKKLGLTVSLVGLLWFVICFFVIIPRYSSYRIEGFKKFALSLGLDTTITRDVENSNYFLSRYEEFGDSYTKILFGMITHPSLVVGVFFGGDKLDNLRMTFEPVGYLPLVYPPVFIMALPDLMINYLTTAGGIGTSEIYNHRVSMVIPVLFLSVIFAINVIVNFFHKFLRFPKWFFAPLITFLVLLFNVYFSFRYENPVYLWLTQAVGKKFTASLVYAKTNSDVAKNKELKIGDVLRLSRLENKDRECANKIIELIPDDASISGPDYLGAHLAKRETYAIFPALYNVADYVIVDVFSKKILNILDIDLNLIHDVVGNIIRDPNYKLEMGCGNIFVFKKIGFHNKDVLLPLQEKFNYEEKIDYEIFQTLTLVDYNIPKEALRGQKVSTNFAFTKRASNSLDDYVLFFTFINEETGDLYQVASLPSFGLTPLRDWAKGRYYTQKDELIFPKYLDSGTYKAFIGMTNNIRTRSIYLGDIELK